MKSETANQSAGMARMAYQKFSLQMVVERFALKTVTSQTLFDDVTPCPPSPLLSETFNETIPLGLAIGTEKARSELIVMPLLVEIRRILKHQISVFSGIEFNVEPSVGLKGICDFLVSKSDEQYIVRSPVIAVVEAKKGEIEGGLGQCAAEMVAVQKFNDQHQTPVDRVAGIVTTGSSWKFLLLHSQTLTIQADETSIEHVDRILGMFVKLLTA